jgi:hypothetical protein
LISAGLLRILAFDAKLLILFGNLVPPRFARATTACRELNVNFSPL